jgi:DNA-binding NarL/FixJ family response regulator
MMDPIRVLIADDHQVVREGLHMILSDVEDIVVVGQAADGAEAVRLASKLKPDVAVFDLRMPQRNGVEAAREMSEAGLETRVLILTSFDDEKEVREAVRAGVTGYLMKDVMKDELLKAIRAANAGQPTLHPKAQRHLMKEIATPPQPSPLDALTPREREVLTLIARGLGNKQIAGRLSLSVGTVKGYVSAIFEKLGVQDRTRAALLAVKHGLE